MDWLADIIRRVKRVESPPFRPTVPAYREVLFVPQYYHLMERCWSEDPSIRPDFRHIVETLRTFGHRSHHVSPRLLLQNSRSYTIGL